MAVLKRRLRRMPNPFGLVTWRPSDGAETLAASVDEYLPNAVTAGRGRWS